MGRLEHARTAYGHRLERALQRLLQNLSGREEVERVILFGSYARGRRDLGTDLDVVIIMRTNKDFLDRLRDLYATLNLGVDIDILCYTPEEWETVRTTSWGRHIEHTGVVLYEKESAG